MVEIQFKNMKLLDERNVSIIGSYKNQEITIKMSVLQLAVLLGTDKGVFEKYLEFNYNPKVLEEECEETRKAVENFSGMKFKRVERICHTVDIYGKPTPFNKYFEGDIVKIFTEDLSGWDNEGIIIKMPKQIFDSMIGKKEMIIMLTPESIVFEEKGENWDLFLESRSTIP